MVKIPEAEQQALMEAARYLYRFRKSMAHPDADADAMFIDVGAAMIDLIIRRHKIDTEEEFMNRLDKANPMKARA